MDWREPQSWPDALVKVKEHCWRLFKEEEAKAPLRRAGGLVSSSILWAHKITRQEHFPGQQLLFTNPLPESHNQEDKNFLFHKLSAEATLQRNCWCDNTNALLMFKE
ncbi:hypothetical protein CUMW_217770 [Citrus unshiu]|nr:hypothetical protein CUMW_217770 [Citrus unshiu]